LEVKVKLKIKKILALITLVFCTQLKASEIKLLDAIVANYQLEVESTFQINSELERAWVKIKLINYQFEEAFDEKIHLVKLTELSYNAESKMIELVHEGQLIECAEVIQRGRWIFRHEKIANRSCKFETRFKTEEYDDGFHIRKRKRLQVFLVIATM